MVFLYGTRLLGQADCVDDTFWVATEFFHIFWAPVFPISGKLVLAERLARQFRKSTAGVPAPADGSTPAAGGESAPPPAPAAAAVATPAGAAGPASAPDSQPSAPPDADGLTQEQLEEAGEDIVFNVPMSGRSVLLGYLRGWGFWLTLFIGALGGMLAAMSSDDPWAAMMWPRFLIFAGVAFILSMASYYGPWNQATPQRARQLCQAAGLDLDYLPEKMRQG